MHRGELAFKRWVMAKKQQEHGLSFPTTAMIVISIVSALIVGLSFEVIKVWPQPQSVEPYFGFFDGGWMWGACIGGVSGFVLGFLTDDRHFMDS